MKKFAAIICCFALLWMQTAVMFGGVVHESAPACHCTCDARANSTPAPNPAAAARPQQIALKQVKQQEVRETEPILDLQRFLASDGAGQVRSTHFVPASPPPLYERHCSYLI